MYFLAFFAVGWLAGPAAAAEPAETPPPTLKLILSLGVEEYNPRTPSKASVKLTLKNEGKTPIRVPGRYGEETLALHGQSGRWPLKLSRANDLGPKGGLIEVKPGEERVLFILPLDDILHNGHDPAKLATRDWRWDWSARPTPPLSPIHDLRAKGFVSEATFWGAVSVDGKVIESPRVKLKVKPPK